MAHVISKDECIQCGACETECPEGSISIDAEGFYNIDESKCSDCASCVDVCPSGAISPK
jgi:NAD-dependent dihydropyrimidine dehydrogenase PreA subunit